MIVLVFNSDLSRDQSSLISFVFMSFRDTPFVPQYLRLLSLTSNELSGNKFIHTKTGSFSIRTVEFHFSFGENLLEVAVFSVSSMKSQKNKL